MERETGAIGSANDTSLGRRDFVKRSVVVAAGLALPPALLPIVQASQGAQQPQQLPPLGNGEPPALVFQAYPGGTGAYLERLARERGRAAFERTPFEVEPWTGPVPRSEEELAYLPAHRLAALIAARHLSPVTLTEIYLERLKRLDPVLLCAVTILEGPAKEAAQQAESEIRSGQYRGPLHGLPWGLKDLFATKGIRTTWGSKAH
ncbi:MAG TPA: amidase family protein, partial [Gemmatimonadaceae bacterium]|nr:amidase family protein [Gemmatimonadaceae bacterium]